MYFCEYRIFHMSDRIHFTLSLILNIHENIVKKMIFTKGH